MKTFIPQRRIFVKKKNYNGIYYCQTCNLWVQKIQASHLEFGNSNGKLVFVCPIHNNQQMTFINMDKGSWIGQPGLLNKEWPTGSEYDENVNAQLLR